MQIKSPKYKLSNSPEDVLLDSKLDKEPDKYRSLSATYYVNKNNPPIECYINKQTSFCLL